MFNHIFNIYAVLYKTKSFDCKGTRMTSWQGVGIDSTSSGHLWSMFGANGDMQWWANNSRQIWKYWTILASERWFCVMLLGRAAAEPNVYQPATCFHPLWPSILGSSTFCSSYGSTESFIAHVLPKGLLWMDKRSVHYFPARSNLLAGVEVRTLMGGVQSVILGVTAPSVAGKIYNDSHFNDNN